MNHDKLNLNELHIPLCETTRYGDYTIVVDHDEDPTNPREEWDNMGTMVCWHRRYNLGDDHNYQHLDHLMHELSGLYSEEIYEYLTDAQLQRCRDVAEKTHIILPLYLYDHSGITMSTTSFACSWDSGKVGVIYVSLADVRKEYSKQRVSSKVWKLVEQSLTAEVKTYDCYLTNEVYGFTITKGKKIVDSCYGFIGNDDSGIEAVIKEQIAYDITQSPQQTEMELE